MKNFCLPLLSCQLSTNSVLTLTNEERSALHKLNTMNLIDNVPVVRAVTTQKNGRYLIECYGALSRD